MANIQKVIPQFKRKHVTLQAQTVIVSVSTDSYIHTSSYCLQKVVTDTDKEQTKHKFNLEIMCVATC